MAKGPMSQELKNKMAAGRAAAKAAREAGGQTGGTKVSLDDKIAALAAQADAGDEAARAILPTVEVFKQRMEEAKETFRAMRKRLAKVVNAVSN